MDEAPVKDGEDPFDIKAITTSILSVISTVCYGLWTAPGAGEISGRGSGGGGRGEGRGQGVIEGKQIVIGKYAVEGS